MRRKYILALYDWNGTVADDPRICHECVLQLFRVFGAGLPLPSFEEWRAEHTAADFLKFYYDRGVPRTMTIDKLREVWTGHYEAQATAKKQIVREGVAELLELCQAREILNVIVSSSIDDVEQHLRNGGVHHLFHAIHLRIPNKEAAFQALVREHGILPEQAFYVDDTFDGVVHANRVGLDTFGLTTGCHNEELVRAAKPNHVVSSFHDIRAILEQKK